MLIPLLILSLVQGLTEFLPVSSSGHLVIAKLLFGLAEKGLEIELWLHVGTLAALVAYFWRDLATLAAGRETATAPRNWIPRIILSTAVTGVLGLFARKYLISAFSDIRLTFYGFIATGALLLATRLAREKRTEITWADAAWFGLAQAVAILPSISRSGATIACLLFLGIGRREAFYYSFLASIPVLALAFLLEVFVGSFRFFTPGTLALSFATTFATGLVTLHWLRGVMIANRFHWFGFYCVALGVLGFLTV